MLIDEKSVKHISHLARIGITDKEIRKFQKQLDEIIVYIDKLRSLDVEDVKPMAHILPLKNIFREDKKKNSLPTEEVLKNAPSKKDKFFSVPKVVE